MPDKEEENSYTPITERDRLWVKFMGSRTLSLWLRIKIYRDVMGERFMAWRRR